MAQYMNYGALGTWNSSLNKVEIDNTKITQVFQATHDGEGNPLSNSRKIFISFSFGGKNIEDFNLIAVNSNDFYERKIYTEFEDQVTKVDLIDGQYYWGSSLSPNTLEFTLATDEITESQLQDFKNWFRPGVTRELILSEAPNRIGYARVAESPEMSMLPFEEKTSITIGGIEYFTSTTVWRGEINLSLVMDDPVWEAKDSLYYNINNDLTKEQIKTIIEDGIPHSQMLITTATVNTLLLANKIKVRSSAANIHSTIPFDLTPSTKNIFLYNCGTAPTYPTITFSFNPTFNEEGTPYINFPYNKYMNDTEYCYIKVGSHAFYFTTPGILTAYNQAIKILYEDFYVNDSIEELRKAFRDTLGDMYIRAWVLGICDLAINSESYGICNSNGALMSSYKEKFTNYLKQFFVQDNGEIYPITCTFNSLNGLSFLTTKIHVFDLEKSINNGILPISDSEITIEQSAGDMARSNYLIIDERTLYNTNGIIDITNCLPVISNSNLNNVFIDYKYRYY